ncbi:PilT/PilU family type 4a pilus ATPase [Archangium violaceum]|uniref:type IV pilus twitching motility protein PilT n=1 Tax=Archangium violaceum TaxID=83451 RepID=UPI002B2B4010|nr:PilT/PilU family type 4a pilus ATPase [Archangium gephyra]
MKTLTELMRHLNRPGAVELALISGRNPMVKLATGAFEALDPTPLTVEGVQGMLSTLVGEARATTVSDKPSQWALRLEGLGPVIVGALRRGDVLNVRVVRTEPVQAGAPTPRPPAPAATPATSAQRPASPKPSKGVQILPTEKQAPAPTAPPAEPPPPAPEPVAEVPQGPRLVVRPESARNLTMLLEDARTVGASDLHVVAGRPPLFRLVGELLPHGDPLPPETVETMLLPHIPERLRPVLDREGSCDFSLDLGQSGRFRVNVSRQRTGYKGCFRLIPREIPTLESLGLPVDIAKATHHHQGLIVVTGPSGHGKTSTLAAIVNRINCETTHHVLTVEDPVEYLHPRRRALLSQREVGTHTRSFATALKGSLREDPDVILVGELRDTETVRMALSASETGHLLVSTMNTPSAAKTIDRLIDLFPPGDQAQVRMTLASSLRLIVSQRLLPSADRQSMVVAAELLPGSVALGNLIRDNKTYQIPSLQQRGKSLGIVRFDDSLADLVRSGKTTLEIAKAYAESPDELEAVVTGKRPGAPPEGPPSPDGGKLLSKMGNLLNRKSA